MGKKPNSVLASNRKARHDYSILDVVEAGIVLLGSEVKSLRGGQVQLVDAYARIIDGEVCIHFYCCCDECKISSHSHLAVRYVYS